MIAVKTPDVECLESVPGCADCQAEANYRGPHRCSSDSEKYFTMCEVFGRQKRKNERFHRLTHEPSRCQKCDKVVRDNVGYDVLKMRACKAGYCREAHCPYCDALWSSDGPVACPACGSWGRDPRISRMHRKYRRQVKFTRSGKHR